MLSLTPAVRIYLASAPTDMRNSIDGLAGMVTTQWGQDVYTGHLFVFVSRRGDRIKVLTWSHGGFVLYYKRLEQGRFRMPRVEDGARSISLDSTQLSMLLDGIDYSRVKQPRRWSPGGIGQNLDRGVAI